MAIEKIKILGAVLKLHTSHTALPIQPIYLKIDNIGQIDSGVYVVSQTAPRILNFSIVLVAEYSFYV